MPDIQTAFKTALSKTLQQWDDDGDAPPLQPVSSSFPQQTKPTQPTTMKKTFGITNNISRVTFDYIKNNPGSTRKEIIQALEHEGFGGGSVSSLIAQMRRNKMVHETNGLHYADIDEYRPIKTLKAINKEKETQAPKRKYEKKAVTGIGALLQAKLEAAPTHTPDETPSIVPTRKGFVSLVRNRTPESIIDNMTVYQARELYDHLKKIFNA